MKFSNPSPKRQGVILLVVISLLVLFSLVGIAFVIYAESQANTARIWREGETSTRPDADPELLLAYFLSQLVYDTDNPFSALRGHSLTRNMYGRPGSTTPYNGTGRIHTGGADDFYQVNYTQFGAAARSPDQLGSPNVPYTYPDFNNMFLAAQKAGLISPNTPNTDGAMLIGSWHRPGPPGVGFGSLAPGNPNWNNPAVRNLVLRPLPADHAGFPPPQDAGGDVKNVADSPGVYIAGSNPPQFTNNDSFWMDLGFPVRSSPDGRKYKPLFASLVLGLDNRINANVHGNVRGSTSGNVGGLDPNNGVALSDQGWGPWEVNPRWVLQGVEGVNPEARRLFVGNVPQGTKGLYDLNLWGTSIFTLPTQYASKGHFYNATNFDGSPPGSRGMFLPGAALPAPQAPVPLTSAFPYFSGIYDNGDQNSACRNHPLLYSPFMPQQAYYSPGAQDSSFPVGSAEALLRYRDSGSPALGSPLFRCCPLSFQDGKARRLVTPLSMDVDRPGVLPWIWSAPGTGTYNLAAANPTTAAGVAPVASSTYPTGPALPVPPPGAAPAGGTSEFSATWQAATAALGRINLNRPLPDYPPVVNGKLQDPAPYPLFTAARSARQDLARDIFAVLRQTTGASDPATTTFAANPKEYNALRWLAQLAVNMVDYIANDDYCTPFKWNTYVQNGDWVYGTKLPRLVVNEVYCEVQNDPTDTGKTATKDYQVKFWVELHNPLYAGAGMNGQISAVPMTENADARLQFPDTPADPNPPYRLTITTKNKNLRDPANTRGDPDDAAANIPTNTPPGTSTIQTELKDYTWDTTATQQQTTLMGDELNLVHPSNGLASGADASNKGYYVVGPGAGGNKKADEFPGGAPPNASLRAKQTVNPVGTPSSGMVSALDKSTDLSGALPQKYTILLRRLACPAMPYDNNLTSQTYNPYITVDYMEDVQPWDAVTLDSKGKHTPSMMQTAPRCSVGRNQPYAADSTQRSPQVPTPPPQNNAASPSPQHTLFKSNQQGSANPVPFDWLVFANRPLISPMELLQVSAFKPQELTQMFMTGGLANGVPSQKFTHRAPWFDSSARIYRSLEFLSANPPIQWVPTGGRTMGKININDVWDMETLLAVADPVANNFFTPADAQTVFGSMMQSRSPKGYPDPSDRPFRAMAAPNTGDTQGLGVDDTFLRTNPNPPMTNPTMRLFEHPNLPPEANGHPYLKYELMRKVFNNFTTRSNVFAVYLTVGFFEVIDDSDPTRPPKLGAELGKIANEHIRHRMFAIVDRTNASVDFNKVPGPPAPVLGAPGAKPFFINSLTPVTTPGQATITVPGLTGTYEGNPWSISLLATPFLVIDTGANQEIVQLTQAPVGAVPFFEVRHHEQNLSSRNSVTGRQRLFEESLTCRQAQNDQALHG